MNASYLGEQMATRMILPTNYFDRMSHQLNSMKEDDLASSEELSIFIGDYGANNYKEKIERGVEIGGIDPLITSRFNPYIKESKDSYILGNYFVSTLGSGVIVEKIMNEIAAILISDIPVGVIDSDESKRIRRGKGITNWNKLCTILEKIGVFETEDTATALELKKIRNSCAHYSKLTSTEFREKAKEASDLSTKLVGRLFGAFNKNSKWSFYGGNRYFVKKSLESHGFIKEFYKRQCPSVSQRHFFDQIGGHIIVCDIGSEISIDASDDDYRGAVLDFRAKRAYMDPLKAVDFIGKAGCASYILFNGYSADLEGISLGDTNNSFTIRFSQFGGLLAEHALDYRFDPNDNVYGVLVRSGM